MAVKFQDKIKRQMEAQGYLVLNVIRLGANGYPDLLCIKDGKNVWIECKEEKDTLKPLQKARIQELRRIGCEAYCLQKGKGKIF